MSKLKAFIEEMPTCELRVHIEGPLKPEMKFQLAQRNKVKPALHSGLGPRRRSPGR